VKFRGMEAQHRYWTFYEAINFYFIFRLFAAARNNKADAF